MKILKIFLILCSIFLFLNGDDDYKTQNIVFVNECGSCHTLYPTKLIA